MAQKPVTDQERLANMQEFLTDARLQTMRAQATDDPVARRRFMVSTAKALRGAAAWLDDEGRITE